VSPALVQAPAAWLEGCDLRLKREDEHVLGAFKWRGALPVVTAYRATGHGSVVTASTGNHGAATAWAAARCGLRAVVFVPEGSSAAKLELLRTLGAELEVGGRDLDEAKEAALAYAGDRGLPFFEDGAEPAQYEGYGDIADEILAQGRPDAVLVPVGNGALLAGIGLRFAERSPATRRIGVVAAGAPVMARSFAAGHPVQSESSDTFADGMAVRVAIPRAVQALAQAADEMVEVDDRAIARAVGAFADAGMRVEGSAAAALAGAWQLAGSLTGTVVLIVTGRNIDDALWRRAVERPESFASASAPAGAG
jgi:threonine dehydratase